MLFWGDLGHMARVVVGSLKPWPHSLGIGAYGGDSHPNELFPYERLSAQAECGTGRHHLFVGARFFAFIFSLVWT